MTSNKKELSEELKRKLKIKQLVKDVKSKYQSLRLGKSENDKSVNQIFSPITERLDNIKERQVASIIQHAVGKTKQTTPLKSRNSQLGSWKQKPENITFKTGDIPFKADVSPLKTSMEQKFFINNSSGDVLNSSPFEARPFFPRLKPSRFQTSTPSLLSKPKKVEFTPLRNVAETVVIDKENENKEDSVFLGRDGDLNDSLQLYERLKDSQTMDEYIEQYPEIVRNYIHSAWMKLDTIDRVFGPKYHPDTSKWYLGNNVINFNKRTAEIIVGNTNFTGTNGLYELLFHKEPEKYTDEDEDNYKKILKLTNVHRRDYDPTKPMKSSSSFKYKFIIRKLMRDVPSQSGTSLLATYNDNEIEYVYWDDVNEIVDRLRLLYSAKQAGNNSNDNEIQSIIEEIREFGIIY